MPVQSFFVNCAFVIQNMESLKINPVAIEEYALKFTTKVCDGFFTMFKNNATGSEILKITPIDQVNYFTIYNLYEAWKNEVSNLQSPYFDYHKPEVSEALQLFMNTLSMHINVERANLEPIINKSVLGALYLALVPANFYKTFINLYPEKFDINRLKETEKYIKFNKSIFSELIKRLDSIHPRELTKSDLLKLLPSIVEETKNQMVSPEEILKNFTRVISFDIEDFVLTEVKEKPVQAQPEEKAPEDKKQKMVIEDKTINERFSKEQLTLNDMLKTQAANTVHDGIKNKIVDIKSALTVNQRFMFINELFKGESWEFDQAMSQLNAFTNYDAAINMLLETYAIKYNWDTENEQVGELFELVGRKFFNN